MSLSLRKKHWFISIVVCCLLMVVAGCPNKNDSEDSPEGAQNKAQDANQESLADGLRRIAPDPYDVQPPALPTEAELNALGPIREENRELLRFMPDHPSSFVVVHPARLIQTSYFHNEEEFAEVLISRMIIGPYFNPYFPGDRQIPFSNIKRMTFCTTPLKQKPEFDPMTGQPKPPSPANVPTCVCVLELKAPVDDLRLLSLFNIDGHVAVETLAPVMVDQMKVYDMIPPTEEMPLRECLAMAGPTTVVFASGNVSEVTRVFDREPGQGAIPSRVLRTDMQNADLIAMYSAEGVPFGFTGMVAPYIMGREMILQTQGQPFQMTMEEQEGIMKFVNEAKAMSLRINLQAPDEGNLVQVDMDFQTPTDVADWKTGMEKSLSSALTAMNFTVAQHQDRLTEDEKKAASFQISTMEGWKVFPSGSQLQLALKKAVGFDQIFAELLAPGYVQARQAQQAGLDRDSLRVIAMGISRYLETGEARFPHYAIFGENGTPLLSWRVAILPALGEMELFNQFHLNEPWNSEHNSLLIAQMPQVFADPSGQAPVGRTIFRMIGGEGSVLAKFPNGFTWSDLDFPPETLYLLAVVPEQAVVWTQPEVVPYQPETFRQLVRPMFAAMFCTCEVITIPVDDPDVIANLSYWVAGIISPDTAEKLRAWQNLQQLRQQGMLQQQVSPQNNLPQPPPVAPTGNPPMPMPMPPLGQ